METTLPPGPPLPGIFQTLLMFSRPESFLLRCQRRYGRRFTLRLAGLGTYVYLTDPADIRAVFRGDPETFRAGEANAAFLGGLGPASLLVTDGDVHRRQRRLMTPAFHGQALAAQASAMTDIAARDIETWPEGRPFAAWSRMRAITLEVILRTVIGADDERRLANLRRVLPPLLDLGLLSTLRQGKIRLVKARADEALYAEIAACQADPALGQRPDVLAMLARARDEDGAAMTPGELRDHLITLLIAGHETTATGLSWALERLVRHPEILAEAQRAARDGDDRYLDAVIAETLRVRPVVPDVSRKLTRPAEVGGYLLPAGTMVDPAIVVVQRSPENYPEPLRFDPGRFAAGPPDPAVWLPFGGGTRRCIGAAFASMEMRIVLREVLRRVELAPATARDEPAKVRNVTLTPRRGARITVRRRLLAAPSAAAAASALSR